MIAKRTWLVENNGDAIKHPWGQNVCLVNMGTPQLEPTEERKMDGPYPNKESWSIVQFLNHTSFQTGNLRKDAVTLQQVHTVVIPLILFLKRSTLIYSGDCAMRKEKYWNTSRSIGLSVQVDADALKKHSVSVAPLLEWRCLGAN